MKAKFLMEVLSKVDPETDVVFENGQPICSLVSNILGRDSVTLLSEESANNILKYATDTRLIIRTNVDGHDI